MVYVIFNDQLRVRYDYLRLQNLFASNVQSLSDVSPYVNTSSFEKTNSLSLCSMNSPLVVVADVKVSLTKIIV